MLLINLKGKTMKIPKQFKIMGETIKVVFKDDLKDRRDNFGESHHRFNEIWIDID